MRLADQRASKICHFSGMRSLRHFQALIEITCVQASWQQSCFIVANSEPPATAKKVKHGPLSMLVNKEGFKVAYLLPNITNVEMVCTVPSFIVAGGLELAAMKIFGRQDPCTGVTEFESFRFKSTPLTRRSTSWRRGRAGGRAAPRRPRWRRGTRARTSGITNTWVRKVSFQKKDCLFSGGFHIWTQCY